jgi:adenylate kinase
MRLILLGPPGSGKGTQAQRLAQRLSLCHIGTGDMLRDAIARNTAHGKFARSYVEAGKLVPDELVNQIVRERFKTDRPERFVTDGYPRTASQAVAFDEILREESLPLDAVVLLTVDDAEIVRRLSTRNRPDDSEETVRCRLDIYHKTEDALAAHYEAQGLLRRVEGQGDVETIYNKVVKVLSAPVPEGPAQPAPG